MPAARLPIVLRIALLAMLLVLIVLGLPMDDRAPSALRLRGDHGDLDRLALTLLLPVPPPAVLRPTGSDPSEAELALLEAVAGRARLFVELPAGPAPLRARPPDAPRAGRSAAVRFSVGAAPGTTVTARLLGPGGAVLDSMAVAADSAGLAAAAFQVRPGEEGWTEWRVSTAAAGSGAGAGRSSIAAAGAWVAPAGPPRVLAVAGPPSWESRFALRAMERAGVELDLVQYLGRDNRIASGNAPTPWSDPESLARYDAVVLLPGARPSPDALDGVASWVAGGRGLLATAPPIIAELGLGTVRGAPTGRAVPADSLEWSAPAELVPLPPIRLDAHIAPLDSVPASATVAARTSAGDPLLLLAPLGRGRIVALAPMESWRWVMEGDAETGHREFWRSLVDWVSAPAADSLGLRVHPVVAPPGATVDVRIADPPDDLTGLELRRPGGGSERLLMPADGSPRIRFVATDTGTHPLRNESQTLAGFRGVPGDDSPPADLGRARLTWLAFASGGDVLDEVDGASDPGDAVRPDKPGRLPGGLAALIFGLLAVIALVEWSLRRFRGLP